MHKGIHLLDQTNQEAVEGGFCPLVCMTGRAHVILSPVGEVMFDDWQLEKQLRLGRGCLLRLHLAE